MHETDTQTAPAGGGRLRCEEGQTLVEYALILMFVSIAAIGLTPVGQWVALRLANLAGVLGGA